MRKRSLLAVVVALAVVLFSVTLVFGTNAWVPDPARRVVPGELIIGFSRNARLVQINSAVSSVGGWVLASHMTSKVRATRVRLPSTDPFAMQDMINRLKSEAALKDVIKFVEPNAIRKAFAFRRGGEVGGDPELMNQWGYYDIDANWINATSTARVLVAVIDTGVDYNHPDLTGKVIRGRDYVNADTDPMDDMGHGTHVAGIIAAKSNNNHGIIGVSANTKILAIKALDSMGYGNSYDVALAIHDAANSSAKVINMSLGGLESATENDAIDYAVNTKGKLVVASAGNSNTDDYTNAFPAALAGKYPATFGGKVLAVAAHDQARCRAAVDQGDPFSNYGTWVSISAPGYDILSTVPVSTATPWSGDGYYFLSGTSMAAPHVSGAAALAWGENPIFTNTQIANLIMAMNAPVVRNGTCWPNGPGGGTFQRLTVLHILEQQYYESCDNKGVLYGFALDAENGLPLAGAKVTAKQGKIVTGADYVPIFGQYTDPLNGTIILDGFGLFDVLAVPGSSALTIQKTKYMIFSPKDQNGLPVNIDVPICSGVSAGTLPVPPVKPYFWVAITWDYRYTGAFYDLYANFYLSGSYFDSYCYDNPGDLNIPPYVRFFWDSDDPNLAPDDLRRFAESIRISKLTSGGEFQFFVADHLGPPDYLPNNGSSNWGSSGIKAYLYKGKTLLKTYTPPAGAGNGWHLFDIVGATVNDVNTIGDYF